MGRLNSSGSSSILRRELFPLGFAGQAMAHILETWQSFSLHREVRLEEPVTALFKDALVKAYDASGRSWLCFIAIEDRITDPTFGTELGRNDLRFYPPRHHGQSIGFTVECKRLHVRTKSGFRHQADKYVTEGLQRFVDGQYSAGLPCGGMLGYVMDNCIGEAFARVQREINARRDGLMMKGKSALRIPSSVLRSCPSSADTRHALREGSLTIYHLLVGVLDAADSSCST